MMYFNYGDREKTALSKKDPVMKELISKYGHIKRKIDPEPFSALVSSIISQQISTKAAETIKGRLLEKCGKLTAQSILDLTLEEIQGCGLSYRKAGYIQGIAQTAIDGVIDFDHLGSLSDEEIINSLVGLKGVGKWTAEMMLIFTFGRMDVLSLDDLGIRRGIQKAYGLEEIRKDQHQHFRDLFSPYATVASLYLWEESANNK